MPMVSVRHAMRKKEEKRRQDKEKAKRSGRFKLENSVTEALFSLQTKHWVSARQAGPVVETIQKISPPPLQTPPSKETSTISVIAAMCAVDRAIARQMATSLELNLGLDGYSSFFDRSFLEVEVGGILKGSLKEWRALLLLEEVIHDGRGSEDIVERIVLKLFSFR